MKYTLAVEVKLVQIPDAPEPLDMPQPGSDPLSGMVKVASGLMAGVRQVPAFFGPPPGFDFRKQTEISVADFAALALIIGRFDNLVSDIEAEKLQPR